MTAPLTLHSLNDLHTHVRPTSPAEYLRHLIINTLKRKGFEAAEAGTIAELERLLEHRKPVPCTSRKRRNGDIGT
jgi:hypothetical protein